MRNKKIFSFSICIAALSILFVAAVFFRPLNTSILAEENNPTISVEEKNSVEKVNDPTSYFTWKNEWQNNNRIIIQLQSSSDVLEGEYNRDLNLKYSFNLLEGDTKPLLNHEGDTYGLVTPLTAKENPKFNAVKPTQEYEYTHSSAWKNLPPNLDGKFSSSIHFSDAVWENWPLPGVKSKILYMAPTDKPGVQYTFSEGLPSETSYTLHTQVNVDESYEKPPAPSAPQTWAPGFQINIPQLVKTVFKDIDNPEGPSLSVDTTLGYQGQMNDSVTATSKNIPGYTFVSSQKILGPSYGGNGLLPNTYEPQNFLYTGSSEIKDPTPDNSLIVKLSNQQIGIVFWYKKKAPEISIEKNVNKPEAVIGDKLLYTLNPQNVGDDILVNSKIVDTLPQGLGKPSAVTLEGQILPEGSGHGDKYYTWNTTNNELEIFSGDIGINETKKITYETSMVSGAPGEQKINKASLSGDNSTQNPTAEATVTILKEKQYISLSIENILATTGDNDISFVADVTASTKNTDLTNATLTINYPQDNLLLGTMKIIQDDKDITSGTTIDTTKKNTITITGINAKDIQNYPIKVVFSQTEALIELDEITYSGEVFTEDVDIEKASTQYTVEIKKGDLKLLWVPDVLDFKGHNLEEIIEANKNEFESTNIPAYTVVSDTRSKNITNSWRVSVSTSNMNKVNSDEKITDLSYLLGGNELKEYTSSDNSIPPNEENTTSPPASWKDFITVASDTTIINEPGFTSDILSAKTGVENGKYAIKVNQAKLKINDLARITEGDYGGSISWTLIDGL